MQNCMYMLFPKKACQAFIGLVNKYWSQKKVKIFVLLGFKQLCGAYLVAQSVKNLPAIQETWVRSLGWEDPLEKGMAIHSSILAWRIPMDSGGIQRSLAGYSPWNCKEWDTTE